MATGADLVEGLIEGGEEVFHERPRSDGDPQSVAQVGNVAERPHSDPGLAKRKRVGARLACGRGAQDEVGCGRERAESAPL